MKYKRRFTKFTLIICFSLTLASLFAFTKIASSETFYCVVRRDVDIPFPFEYFETRMLANATFEIKFTIRDNTNNKLYVRLIPGESDPNEPDVSVEDKTITYYLGDDLYGSTKSDYEVLGSADDDFEVPAISQLFSEIVAADPNWPYEYDGGDARITDITLSSDQARFKYLEFWDNPLRDGNMHEESQDFEDFDDFDDTEWENLTLNTGAPTLLKNEDALYLTTSVPPNYPPSYYPPYYSPYYPGYTTFPRVYYGNYPGSLYPGSFYPSGSYNWFQSGPLSAYRGNFPLGYYAGYSSSYPWAYSRGYPGGYYGNYWTSYYSQPPFYTPGGVFSGGYAPFLGVRQTPIYGLGLTSFGRYFW